MVVLGCCSLEYKRRSARWVWRVLACCALAGVACSGGSESAPSPVPAESIVASSSVVTTTTAELRTLPYPLVDENEDEDAQVRVRFIAYGDVDPSDDIAFGVIPDLQIAVINDREASEWWNTIGGDDLDDMPPGALMFIPPGAQVRSTAEAIAASPIDFITTGPDGTAEIHLNREYFSVCVISPVDAALIAGCDLGSATALWREMIIYVYFSHGRAYIDREQDGSERYHRFLHGHQGSYNPSSEPATVTFVSTDYADHYSGYDFTGEYLDPDASVTIISDTDIGAWWDTVPVFAKATFHNGSYPLSVAIGWEFGWRIPYSYAAREMAHESTVSTGPTGIVNINLAPGDYMFCHLTGGYVAGCDYEDIAAAQSYVFYVSYGVSKLSDSEGKQLLKDAENWEIEPSP